MKKEFITAELSNHKERCEGGKEKIKNTNAEGVL